MLFSVTETETYLRCPRKAFLTSANGMHLGPMFSPLALSTGTIVHRAHQLWLAEVDIPLRSHALTAATEEQHKTIERYKQQVGVEPSGQELDTLYESVQFALAMCENYQTKYGQPLPPDHRLISAEQKIRICVPGTEHKCRFCNSLGYTWDHSGKAGTPCEKCQVVTRGQTSLHCLEGRLDGLMQHVPTGQLRILERKTYSQRPKTEVLRSNLQFLEYDYLVRGLGFNADLGVTVAYDGMWRREKPPKGRTFDDLFARYLLPERNLTERAEFAFHLPQWLNKMAELYWNPKDNAYPVRPWKGCSADGCTMDGSIKLNIPSVCYAMSRGEPISDIIRMHYVQRTDDVPQEEQEPSAD